jgi:hypothetical protein
MKDGLNFVGYDSTESYAKLLINFQSILEVWEKVNKYKIN